MARTRRLLPVLLIVILLPCAGCRPHRARQELERAGYFAEILRRVNASRIGHDGFFEKNLLSNPYPEVRRWCAAGLARIGSLEALAILYRGCREGDAAVRAASAFAIGEIQDRDSLRFRRLEPDPRARFELGRLLDDTSPAVRIRAIEALGKIGSESDAARIHRHIHELRGATPEERSLLGFAVTALVRLGYQDAVPYFEKLAGGPDPELRNRAMDALCRLREKSVCDQESPPAQSSAVSGIPMTEVVSRTLAFSRKNRTIAVIQTTRGTLEVELFREDAPATVAFFVSTAMRGGYNGTRFDRIFPSEMVEVEDFRQKAGFGGSLRNEINMRPFERGSIGMTLTGHDTHSGGFFIALAPLPYRDGLNTCFGRVVSGIQILEKIIPGDRVLAIEIKRLSGFPTASASTVRS